MKEFTKDKITLLHCDCMDYMKDIPDNHFDLAIVDPPYGIDVGNMAYLKEVKTTVKQKNGTRLNPNKKKKPHKFKDWDKTPPTQEYFDELKRVSEHQIIFGINYFDWDGVGSGRIKWDKGFSMGMSFGRYEYAYCSMIDYERTIPLLWAGMCQAKSLAEPMTQQGNKKLNEKRTHPCHKPSLLYKRLLLDYATPLMRILDTHLGDGEIATESYKFGCEFVGMEIDEEYYDSAVKRFRVAASQQSLSFS